ncbi:hypothetical protein ACAX43_23880, partial [Paraburkholderia sp. IW21]|uniref:hypothetical protein n=1 Tax=Paraburkholderia sp. IW21 TaxID=3242488 RepID=UPI00352232B5
TTNFNNQLQQPTSTTNFNNQLQQPTSTTNFNNQLQQPTSTTNFNNTHLLPVLQPIGTTVFTIRTTALLLLLQPPNIRGSAAPNAIQGLTSRLFRCRRDVPRFRSNFTKVSQRIE